MKKSRKKWHIKPRVFCMLLSFLLVVFTCIFLAFNLFIQNYIRTNVEEQLTNLIDNFAQHNRKPESKPLTNTNPDLPDISQQPKGKLGTQGQVFLINEDYSIDVSNQQQDVSEAQEIATVLKEKNYNLVQEGNTLVSTSQQYYISTTQDTQQPDSYFVFYVNVSGIYSLIQTVNITLGLILLVALIFCFWIANRVANSVIAPIKKLSAFSNEIGQGHFSQKQFSFQDLEFDKLAETMNDSAQQLSLVDQDQKTFFQNVSHELRTPLMTIRCYGEGIAYGLMDNKKAGTTILEQTDRLTELVEDLLYISRVDSLNHEVEKQENDMRETLSLCAAELAPLFEKRGIHILYQFESKPTLAYYNEKHMCRALNNLLTNALRYAKQTVILRCFSTTQDIELAVIDDGMGISLEDMPHLFERFYKGKLGKQGIGLSIVKSVVELHHGEIVVHSDHGAEFILRLPKSK